MKMLENPGGALETCRFDKSFPGSSTQVVLVKFAGSFATRSQVVISNRKTCPLHLHGCTGKLCTAVVTLKHMNCVQERIGKQDIETISFLRRQLTEPLEVVDLWERSPCNLDNVWGYEELFSSMEAVHVFRDCRYLVSVFPPMAGRPNKREHVLAKVHRWTIYLSQFGLWKEQIYSKNSICAYM